MRSVYSSLNLDAIKALRQEMAKHPDMTFENRINDLLGDPEGYSQQDRDYFLKATEEEMLDYVITKIEHYKLERINKLLGETLPIKGFTAYGRNFQGNPLDAIKRFTEIYREGEADFCVWLQENWMEL